MLSKSLNTVVAHVSKSRCLFWECHPNYCLYSTCFILCNSLWGWVAIWKHLFYTICKNKILKIPEILSVFSSFLLVLSRELLHNNHWEEFFMCLLDQLLGKKTESKINIWPSCCYPLSYLLLLMDSMGCRDLEEADCLYSWLKSILAWNTWDQLKKMYSRIKTIIQIYILPICWQLY